MKKKNLVLISALMCDSRMYQHQADTLNEYANVNVFSVASVFSVKEAARLIINAMEGEPFFLVGTSMGGYIAMEIMRQAPHLVNKLCLVGTTWDVDSQEKIENRLHGIKSAESVDDAHFIGVSDSIIASYLYNKVPENYTLIKDMARTIGRRGFINQQHIILSRPSSVLDFSNYDIPTLIISGKYDPITPTAVHRTMTESLPFGSLIILDNCSHLASIDQPVAISALLAYWLNS